MEPNPDRDKQIQSYVPIIQDFATKHKRQTQAQAHHEIKIQYQYERITFSTSSIQQTCEIHYSYFSKASDFSITSFVEAPFSIFLLFKSKISMHNLHSFS